MELDKKESLLEREILFLEKGRIITRVSANFRRQGAKIERKAKKRQGRN